VERRLIYILDLVSMQYKVYELSDLGIEKEDRIGTIIYFEQHNQ
jgi:predicted transcriptional regulator